MRKKALTSMDPLKRSAQRPHAVPVHGLLLVDKPKGWTSHDVVDDLRRRLAVSKMGHTGTLDPFATGLLVLCLGEATRIAELLTLTDKRYIFRAHLGVETDTLDCTGRVTRVYEGPAVSAEHLRNTAAEMVGPQMQQVPRYAAVKVQGRRLYAWARAGKDMKTPSRPVKIYALDVQDDTWPEITCRVHCSKGTYVRQLAADLGRRLGCGAHVTALRRTVCGPFSVHDALPLDALERMAYDREWMRHVIPLHAALSHLPALVVTDAAIRNRIRHGQLPETWLASQAVVVKGHGGPVRLMGPNNVLLALWWPVAQPGQRRLKVFQSSHTLI